MSSTEITTAPEAIRLETLLRARLGGHMRHLRIVISQDGIILQGSVRTYYAKQVAQHAVMQDASLPILANEIEVS